MAEKSSHAAGPASRPAARANKRPRRAAEQPEERGDAVVSLRRGLEILRMFQPDDGPLSRHEIAQRTGLPNTTAARLIHTLVALGYLSRVGAHGGYRPGPSVLAIGHALIEALPIRRIARPLMQRFAAEFDVWLTLATAEGADMLVLEHVAAPRAPDLQVRSGSLLPMDSTALGRAYLWTQSPEQRAEYLRRIDQRGRSGVARPQEGLGVAFAELDQSSICTAFGTWRRDILGIGTPIVVHNDRYALALACGNTNIATNARVLAEKVGPALLHLAVDIKNGLQQSGSLEDL